MRLPLQVTFRNMDRSQALEADIEEKTSKLDQFYDHIMSCRVVVEAGHKHHQQGNLFAVSIHLSVPGRELVVSRNPQENQAHEDAYVAVRDAFDALRRQLEDFVSTHRGEVKAHESTARSAEVALPTE
jgi:ribosomal subunit interface protein